MAVLENIHSHHDLVQLTEKDRFVLCQEIRSFLVSSLSKTGGHLASNLGVVELTVALETVYNTEKDRLVFDVGHQSYVHKMLTNRQADFAALRQFGGMAGFPKPSESNTDAFVAGHASSSVSIALGMARARTTLKQDYNIVALLGDGAATGGMAYEGLNDAAVSGEPMVIVLNDNAMSIDHNVGGMAYHLRSLRAKPKYLGMKANYRKILTHLPGGKHIYNVTRTIKDWVRRTLIPSTIFESMGFKYLGPVDGHDTELLIELLQNAKAMREPVILHVITHKGHGYKPAEDNPRKFHGVGIFDPESGKTPDNPRQSFSEAFGETMLSMASSVPELCTITAAMPGGTGLLPFAKQFPNRIYDVGIAEEHAVSMAGGLAKQGMIPVVALYSTFLQRSYDMILQDICMLNLHVVFAIDRAGLVGEDGETHHGVFDIGFLRQAPNMKILCPASCRELSDMLQWSVTGHDGPVAIRYPRGSNGSYEESAWKSSHGKNGGVHCHREGKDVLILCYGQLYQNAMAAADFLAQKGVEASVVRMLTLDPLPVEDVLTCAKGRTLIYILEDSCGGGIRQEMAWQIRNALPFCRIYGKDLGKNFVTHGNIQSLHKAYGLDGESICNDILEVLSIEK